jgi:hypothetical protein
MRTLMRRQHWPVLLLAAFAAQSLASPILADIAPRLQHCGEASIPEPQSPEPPLPYYLAAARPRVASVLLATAGGHAPPVHVDLTGTVMNSSAPDPAWAALPPTPEAELGLSFISSSALGIASAWPDTFQTARCTWVSRSGGCEWAAGAVGHIYSHRASQCAGEGGAAVRS